MTYKCSKYSKKYSYFFYFIKPIQLKNIDIFKWTNSQLKKHKYNVSRLPPILFRSNNKLCHFIFKRANAENQISVTPINIIADFKKCDMCVVEGYALLYADIKYSILFPLNRLLKGIETLATCAVRVT